ncbi:phage tail protein [Streptomyces sp. NPDC006422]|uniref:phage tail protein n=1 Tax=unclassified Streptomyces TaxID=2593676 RepID=UPI0033A83568
MAGNTVDIRIRATSQQASAAFKELKSEAAGLKGTLIPLASAAVPLTAAFAPIATKAAGAGLAVAAFGIAAAGQVKHLSNASDAQTKYNEAVAKYGRGSQQAAQAQREVQAAFASMPQATAQASVGLSSLKDTFREWSDDTAKFTMKPVEHSFAVLEQVIPRLTPMVEGSSQQLDRLVTLAGGAVGSPGFDAFADRVSTFANDSLDEAVDGVIHLARSLSEGEADGPVKAFMDYAKENGPELRETLGNISGAVTTLVEAAADAGPGMLTLVNAAASLVESLPPELVTVLMQTAVALKLVSLAGAGTAAAATGVRALGARIAGLQVASTAAGGGLAGLRAAFASLGTAAKASIVVAGIAAVAVAFGKLGDLGREAPPNVDKLTTSLGQLGRTGRATGEAARLFGSDLDGLYDAVRSVSDPELVDHVQQGLVKVLTLGISDSTPTSEAKEKLDAIDESLTNLVKGGKSEVAAAAFKRLSQEYVDGGGKLSDFTGQMDGYKSTLDDAAFEQQLVADSMGIFGNAAMETKNKLEAQKQSADGLRESIVALNDVNRSAYDAQIGFEESLDSLTESFQKHGATLDLDTKAGRANGQAMSQAAKSQDELIANGLAAGESLGSMTKKSERLRSTMMRLAVDAFDGNRAKARKYVNTLLGAPGQIKTLVKLEREEAIAGLRSVQAAIKKTPGAKSVKVKTLNGAAIKALEAVGLRTKRLPDGRTQVFTKNGKALGSIGAVRRALNSLNGKTSNTYVVTYYKVRGHPTIPSGSYGGSTAGRMASGGLVRRYAEGGEVQLAPDGLVSGPGSGTSDNILALFRSGAMGRISSTEFVVNAASTRKYLPLLEAINDNRLDIARFAKGGKVSKARKAAIARAKARAKAESDARRDARGELTISTFGRRAGYKNPEIRNQLGAPDSVGDLVSSLNKWNSVIKKATHGGTEQRLLRSLDKSGRALLSHERKLVTVNKALDKAKDKLSDLKSAAASLSSSVKSRVLSDAEITKAAGDSDSRVTINTLLSQMTGSAANSKQFASMLKSLKSKGLSKDLISQIAEAGVEGGGMETAAAILGGGKNDIKRLNSLQSQIKSAASSAGKTAADAMYGAGIKAAEGLVKGLQKKQDKIEKQMMKIAKSMEKAIKKALKIKSPSQVMEEVGDYTAEGFALGMRKNQSVTPAWASMLNAPRTTGTHSALPTSGPAGQPVVVHQTITLDGKVIARQIFDPLRAEVAHRGGDVQQALGRR